MARRGKKKKKKDAPLLACKTDGTTQLKCSGDKGGCDRCKASGHACEYSRSSSRKAKKGACPKEGRDGRSYSREQSGSPRSHASSHRTQPSTTKSSDAASGRGSRDRGAALARSTRGESGGAVDRLRATPPAQRAEDVFGASGMAGPAAASAYAGYAQGWAAAGFGDAAHAAAVTTATEQAYIAATVGAMYHVDFGAYDEYPAPFDFANVDSRYWPQ